MKTLFLAGVVGVGFALTGCESSSTAYRGYGEPNYYAGSDTYYRGYAPYPRRVARRQARRAARYSYDGDYYRDRTYTQRVVASDGNLGMDRRVTQISADY